MNNSMVQRAICVLGMHRSGTSAVTRILNLMGVDLGTNLMPSAPENPKGFWENLDFVEINENIFSHLEASWDNVTPAFVALDNTSIPELTPFKEKIVSAVKANFSESSLWGWKDPRTCLFFPLWSEALNTLDIETDVVLAWRNPVSVARSLAKRNHFSAEKSYRLWYAYTLSALYHSRNHRRILIDYDQLMDDWQKEMDKIAHAFNLTWPEDREQFIATVETFINPTLRHSHIPYDQTINELPAYAAELFDILVNTQDIDDAELQQKIHSSYSLYSSLELGNAVQVKGADKPIESANLTLYYSENEHFSEEQSSSEPVSPAIELTFNFDFAPQNPLQLRLDPLDRPGIIDTLNISVSSDDGELLFFGDLDSITRKNPFQDNSLKDCLIIDGQYTPLLITTSNDPQIAFPFINIIRPCTIKISIRVASFIPHETAQIFDSITKKYIDRLQELTLVLDMKSAKVSELDRISQSKNTTITLLQEQISEYKQLVNGLNGVIQAQEHILDNSRIEN